MSANMAPPVPGSTSALASIYPENDGYFVRPEFGEGAVAGAGEAVTGIIANELLGIDDFRRALGLGGTGARDLTAAERLRAAASGATELGLTLGAAFASPFTGGTSLVARGALAAGRGARVVPGLRNLLRAAARNPRRAARLAQIGRSGGGYLERATSPEAEQAEEEDVSPSRPFVMNLPERGATGVAAVPGIDMSFLDNVMPISDYETMLGNELANIEARAAAYGQAVGDEFSRVRSVNEAAVDRALELAAAAGEAGFAAWDRAAQGALDVTETRNAALVQMAGGLPQDIAVGGAAEDFARFASAAGASEQQLQETLGGNRAEDYRWLAEVADQTGAAYQGSIARAEQDAAAAAVARHNQAVLERNAMVAQMQFQAAMQQQQLAAQASIANAGQAGAGSMEEIIGTAVSLADRPGGNDGALLYQLFPDVFPSVADAQGFVDSLGSANPFG